MKVKVKICGIRSFDAAQAAIAEGADFIGFNFVPSSKRHIDPEVCQTIISHIRGKIKIVGVFQNGSVIEVNSIAKQLDLNYVQLHGDEDDDYMRKIDWPIIKSVNGSQIVKSVEPHFLLVDRIQQGIGSMIDFTLARDFAEKKEIFFAGGLTPDNVASVVESVNPYAVDVAGGIETNGKEDLAKIGQFIKNAKGVTV